MNAVLLNQIPTLFKEKSDEHILTIERNNKSYSLSVSNQSTPNMIQSSIDCLKEMIGENRLKQICKRPEIKIDANKIDQNTLILTKNVMRKILIGFLDVQITDLNALPGSIHDRFKQHIIFNTFQEFESSLLEDGPKLSQFKIDKAKTSGKGFEGLAERVYICMHHHFKVIEESNKKAAELRDVEMLTSRLADREIRLGSVIHLHDGYFYVDKVIIGGGAYVAVLRDVEGVSYPKIVCRGTAMRSSATDGLKTGLNDLLLEIGTMGIKNVWPELARYLKENQIASVNILGKSLGGAHAQELAVLIEGVAQIKVERLITYCSVGAGNNINVLFKNEVLEKRETPFKIQIIRNGSPLRDEIDYIPAVGGVHLGEGSSPDKCDIEVCYIQPEEQEEVGVYPKETAFFNLMKNFFRSFSSAHCRQTTLNKFSWKRIDAGEVHEHLRVGNQLEKIRQCFAYLIHLLTLLLLNGKSFTSYFHSQAKRFRASDTSLSK